MRKILVGLIALIATSPVFAQLGALQDHCFVGGKKVVTNGLSSSNYADILIPSCTVTVYLTGSTTKATIYSDSTGTVLANPFTAHTAASVDPAGWIFWAAANAGLDVVMSGGVPPNTYPQPVTLTAVFPNGSFSPVVNPLTIQTNEVGNASQVLLDFKDTASVLFTNPSGGIESATVPDGSNSSKGILKCDGTTTDCTGGTIVANPSVSIQTNGTPNTSQVVLNHHDTSSVTWANPSGGIEEANVNLAGGLTMQIIPPISGQYVFVPATVGTVIDAGFPVATASPTSASLFLPTGASFEQDATVQFSNFILPSYIVAGNVTAVYGVVVSSQTNYHNLNSLSVPGQGMVSTITCGSSGQTNIVPSGTTDGWTVQQSSGLTTVTGTDFNSSTCTAHIGANYSGGGNLIVSKIGLLVYYTGTAPPVDDRIIVVPPLTFNPDNNHLAEFVPSNIGMDTGAANAYAATVLGWNFQPGLTISLLAAHANTLTTPTFSFNGGAARTIVGTTGAALGAGDIVTTIPAVLTWSGTNWVLQNPQVSGGGGGGSSTVGTAGQMQMVGATPGSHAASACTDNGTTITCTEPIDVPGPPFGFSVDAGTPVAGASGTVVYASDATVGYAEVNENNTGLSRICTAANAATNTGCQGGAGSIPLVSRVSVMDYGAVADGNLGANTGTDNTTAFTSCLTAAIAAKDVCYVPAGVYRIATSLPTISVGGTGFVGDVWGYDATAWSGPVTTIFSSSASATILTISSGSSSYISGDTLQNISLQRSVTPNTGSKGLLMDHAGGAVVKRNVINDSSIAFDLTNVPYFGVGIFEHNQAAWCYSGVSAGAGPNIGFNLHGGTDGFLTTVLQWNAAANGCGASPTSYGFKIDGVIWDLNMANNVANSTSYGVYASGTKGQDVHIIDQTDDNNGTACEYIDYGGAGYSTDLRGGWCDGTHPTTGGTTLHNARGVKVSERQYYDTGAVFPDGVTVEAGSTGNSVSNNTFYQSAGTAIICNASNGNNYSGNTINNDGNAAGSFNFTNCSNNVLSANKVLGATSTVITLDSSSNNNYYLDINQFTSTGSAISNAGTGNTLPSSSGLSGMTATQVPIAATASTVASSKALAGSGTGIVTGPTSSTVADHIVTENGTNGQVKDSGVLITAIPAADIASGALANGMTATTQSAADNSTKVATTAYVDAHFIASGTSAMGTSAISSGTCASVVTTAATGTATTDVIVYTPNADPTGVTGYAVSASGSLYIWAYPTSGNVNFKVCNNTGGSLTPSALTLNWTVRR